MEMPELRRKEGDQIPDFLKETSRYADGEHFLEKVIELEPGLETLVKGIESTSLDYLKTVLEWKRAQPEGGEEFEKWDTERRITHDSFIAQFRALVRNLNERGKEEVVEFARDWFTPRENRAAIADFALKIARRMIIEDIEAHLYNEPSPQQMEEWERDFIELMLRYIKGDRSEELIDQIRALASKIDSNAQITDLFWKLTENLY